MLETVGSALLVEMINADQFPGQIAGLYPFIKGYLNGRGVPNRWVRFGISTSNLHRHGRDEVTLDADEVAHLLSVYAEVAPELVLTTHRLWGRHLEALQSRLPGVKVVTLPELLAAREATACEVREEDPEDAQFRDERELDRPEFEPDYRFEPGNAAAAAPDRNNVYILLDKGCGYRRSVLQNPCFAGVPLGPNVRGEGCSFCGAPRSRTRSFSDQTPLERIGRQLQAVCDGLGPDRLPNSVMFENIEDGRQLEFAATKLRELGMDSVRLLFGARVDRILRLETVLRDQLARMEERGGQLHLFVSGLENFSDPELLRMNKGYPALSVLRAVRVLQELEFQFPRHFHFSGYAALSAILFTPWTSFADLHLNVRLLQHLRIEGAVGNVFLARLRLHPDLAISALARHDGVIVDGLGDDALRLNRRKLFAEELPWRFLEPRLESVNAVATRLERDAALADDGLAAVIEAAKVRHWPERTGSGDWERIELIALFRAVVEEAEAAPGPLGLETLVERAFAHWAIERERRSRDAETPLTFGLGEERLPLTDWLRRVLPAVADGSLPTVAIGAGTGEGLDDESLAAARAAVEEMPGLQHVTTSERKAAGEGRTLIVGARRADVARRLALVEPLRRGDADAAEEAARLAGAPACCARAWAASPWRTADARGWSAVAARMVHGGPIPAALNPLLLGHLGFVPCEADCAAAAARYRALLARLGVRYEDRVFVATLTPSAPAELVGISEAGRSDDGLEWSAGAVSTAPRGELRATLLETSELVERPGQLELRSGVRVRARRSADVVVWDPERALHADTWVELAAAVRRWRDPENLAAARVSEESARETLADRRIRAAPADTPDESSAHEGDESVSATAAASVPESHREQGLKGRAGTLRVRFTDRAGRIPEMVFFIGAVAADEPCVRRVQDVGLAHLPCRLGKAFHAAVDALGRAMDAVREPPRAANLLRWERAVMGTVLRGPLRRRFHCSIDTL